MKWYQFRIRVVFLGAMLAYFISNPLIALIDYGKPMELNFCPPCIIVYKSNLPDDARAASKGTIIYIQPEDKGNVAILQHELIHCKQYWLSAGMNVFLYHYLDKFRLMYELEAFKEQMKYENEPEKARMEAALLLSNQYRLSELINFEMAYLLLGDK